MTQSSLKALNEFCELKQKMALKVNAVLVILALIAVTFWIVEEAQAQAYYYPYYGYGYGYSYYPYFGGW